MGLKSHTDPGNPPPTRRLSPSMLLVTGMSGAGRTTVIGALEDLGYEALNNFPLSLIETLIESMTETSPPIAIGVESRTRGFSASALTEIIDRLRQRWRTDAALIFLDCDDDVLLSRFSETRRRHPLAPAEDVATGIARERDVLGAVRDRADAIIDTSDSRQSDLKAELSARFALDRSAGLSVSVQSFSYKRGVPQGADMVMDCRFLRNPYWDKSLRPLDGRDPRIQSFVREDPLYGPFFEKFRDMVTMLLPAYRDEGKTHFTIALGCTGGLHRSVTVAEEATHRLAEAGWTVSVRHAEIERARRGSR